MIAPVLTCLFPANHASVVRMISGYRPVVRTISRYHQRKNKSCTLPTYVYKAAICLLYKKALISDTASRSHCVHCTQGDIRFIILQISLMYDFTLK